MNKKYFLIIFLVLGMFVLPCISAAGTDGVYHTEETRIETNGAKIYIVSPVEGSPVQSGQIIELRVILFINQLNSSTVELNIIHNGEAEYRFTEEDEYIKEMPILRDDGETETIDFELTINGETTTIHSTSCDISLTEPSIPYNPHWEEKYKEQEEEYEEIIERATLVTVDIDFFVKLLIGFGVVLFLLSVFSHMLPALTKVYGLEDEFLSAVNVPIFVFGGAVFMADIIFLTFYLDTTVPIEEFVNAVLIFIMVLFALLTFFGNYMYAWMKQTIPGERYFAKLMKWDKTKWALVLMKHRIYEHDGEQCIAIKGKGAITSRLKGKHMLFKVQDNITLEGKEILLNGGTPLIPVGGWGVRPEKVSELKNLDDQEKRGRLGQAYGEGKHRRVFEVSPSAYVTYGRTYFESLWNHAASEQVREEREKNRKLIQAFRNYNKFAKKYNFSEEIHALFECQPFDIMDNPKLFRKFSKKLETRLDELDRETQKRVALEEGDDEDYDEEEE